MLRLTRLYSVSAVPSVGLKEISDALRKKDYPAVVAFLSQSTLNSAAYNTILKQCIDEKHPASANLKIGQAAYQKNKNTVHRTLLSLKYSSDIDVLAGVKQFWDSTVEGPLKNATTTAAYYSVFVNGYILLKQPELAVDMYLKAYEKLKSQFETGKLVQHLPTAELFAFLSKKGHADGLDRCLNKMHQELTKGDVGGQDGILWHNALMVALKEADYKLTKTIFDLYLMDNVETGMFMDNEQILFDESITSQFKLGQQEVFEMLRILAANGDISRCVAIIEMFYVHRVMSGVKAMDKDMCVATVEAYCHNQEASMERVLDVVGGFVNRSDGQDLTYKDITQFMSFKFINTKETEGMAGNILANMDALIKFTNDHINYIHTQKLPPKTVTIFLNCLLNHINVNQNFSAIVRVLTELEKYNTNFKEQWLDTDSIDIILNSMSNSSAAKLCSLHLFKHFRSKMALGEHHYLYFIKSILRGDFRPQLSYYLHFYFQDHKVLHPKLAEILRGLPLDTCPEEPVITEGTTTATSVGVSEREERLSKRPYNYNYDVRDAGYITYLFA